MNTKQHTRQTSESIIIGTILACNQKLYENQNLKRSKKYSKIFTDLYTISNGMQSLNESEIIRTVNAVEFPKTGNLYAYYQKVNTFLDSFEIPLQESLDSLSSVQKSIRNFKLDLKVVIDKLDKQDSFDNYTDNILKVKILSKKPLLVCGYNLINNLALMQELSVKFKLTNQNLLAIVYNKYDKELLFVGYDSKSIIRYDIKTDELVQKEIEQNIKFNPTNYLKELKEITGVNNMFELWVNIQALSLKYCDNLYLDAANTELHRNYNINNSLVK